MEWRGVHGQENQTLSIGPDEESELWRAQARLGYSVLGVLVWTARMPHGKMFTLDDGGEVCRLPGRDDGREFGGDVARLPGVEEGREPGGERTGDTEPGRPEAADDDDARGPPTRAVDAAPPGMGTGLASTARGAFSQ